ncbi:MAG: hypothetical protein KGJ79_09230 [Alphaproteobacteria bacterium]|nr:hypothetical protein [Alphaproteobacteria bacterium]MDE2111311.1 hypothetical protein [Alphaproteobacteria bacterium]MDE2495887.1 hypothetical protein [Alphaproteobacteria bacterium]
MTHQPDSDDEIIAEECRRSRMWTRWSVAGLAFWIGFALLLVAAFRFGAFQQLGIALNVPAALVQWFPMLLLAFAWGAFAVYRMRFRPAKESLRPSVQRKLVDYYLSRQRQILIVFVVMVLIISVNQSHSIHGNGINAWFGPVTFVFIIMLSVLQVVLGPAFLNKRYRVALNDELTRSLRRRAAQVGYMLAVAVIGMNYLVSLAAPQWLARLIPISMASLFVVPALYLVWSEWRASRYD